VQRIDRESSGKFLNPDQEVKIGYRLLNMGIRISCCSSKRPMPPRAILQAMWYF
jgi:hypothetical protein